MANMCSINQTNFFGGLCLIKWNRSSFSNFIESPELITEYLDKIDSYYLLVELA
jgi:hypothetical protein